MALRSFSGDAWLVRSLQSVSQAALNAIPSPSEISPFISSSASSNFLSSSVASSSKQVDRASMELLTTEMPIAGRRASSEFLESMICLMLCFPKNSCAEFCA